MLGVLAITDRSRLFSLLFILLPLLLVGVGRPLEERQPTLGSRARPLTTPLQTMTCSYHHQVPVGRLHAILANFDSEVNPRNTTTVGGLRTREGLPGRQGEAMLRCVGSPVAARRAFRSAPATPAARAASPLATMLTAPLLCRPSPFSPSRGSPRLRRNTRCATLVSPRSDAPRLLRA